MNEPDNKPSEGTVTASPTPDPVATDQPQAEAKPESATADTSAPASTSEPDAASSTENKGDDPPSTAT